MVHRFIAAEKANHSVSMLCEVLEVSRSGYYAAQRRPACRRDVEDARLGVEIRTASGALVARHRRAPQGAGQTIRSETHAWTLEREVLAQFSIGRPAHRRKANRPPGEAALATGCAATARSWFSSARRSPAGREFQ